MTPTCRALMLDVFSGPRHDRLRKIWQWYAGRNPSVAVEAFPNPACLPPERALLLLWQRALECPERYVIITEQDFLPDPTKFADGVRLVRTTGAGAAAGRFVNRNPRTRELVEYGNRVGSWYVAIDKQAAPPDFDLGRGREPANDVSLQLQTAYLETTDCLPEHWGVRLPVGEHLFFSRHYNDPPGVVVAGIPLDDVLAKVDKRIDRYFLENKI